MTDDVRSRLEQTIREEDERSARRLRASRDRILASAEKFEPVKQAAEALREQLSPLSSIEITVNPDEVWISLFDRELRFRYDGETWMFVGEEGLHSWYDGEAYSYSYEWETAEGCIDAMIRLCARYVRMARAWSHGGDNLMLRPATRARPQCEVNVRTTGAFTLR